MTNLPRLECIKTTLSDIPCYRLFRIPLRIAFLLVKYNQVIQTLYGGKTVRPNSPTESRRVSSGSSSSSFFDNEDRRLPSLGDLEKVCKLFFNYLEKISFFDVPTRFFDTQPRSMSRFSLFRTWKLSSTHPLS